MRPEANTGARVFALLGDPVDHSLSPLIQNAAIRAAGVNGQYVAQRCHADDVQAAMRALARAGGGGNVTIPHKGTAAAALDVKSEAVERTGACNTFWQVDGRLAGDNTDVPGFERALAAFIGDPQGARVLLLGAGGGAAAALLALLQANVGSVTVLNRTAARAHELVARIAPAGDARVRVAVTPVEVGADRFDLAVNATSLGLHAGDPLPLPVGGATRYGAAFDMVYGAAGTAWTRAAEAAGIRATDGREMLLQQAAVAFERWWSRPAPVDVMRGALSG